MTVLSAACVAVIIVGAFIWIILPLATRLTGKPIDFSAFNAMHGNFPLVVRQLIPTWVFAGGAEEMVFRAYLMNRLADLFGKPLWGDVGVIHQQRHFWRRAYLSGNNRHA